MLTIYRPKYVVVYLVLIGGNSVAPPTFDNIRKALGGHLSCPVRNECRLAYIIILAGFVGAAQTSGLVYFTGSLD